MSRPCEHIHSPTPSECRLCWLYVNDSRYKELWDIDGYKCNSTDKPRVAISEIVRLNKH